jgi:hypothetical protein
MAQYLSLRVQQGVIRSANTAAQPAAVDSSEGNGMESQGQ